jgi:transcriptional regulator with XRE-family HTH domain
MTFKQQIGREIARARTRAGLKQKELADKKEADISLA